MEVLLGDEHLQHLVLVLLPFLLSLGLLFLALDLLHEPWEAHQRQREEEEPRSQQEEVDQSRQAAGESVKKELASLLVLLCFV